MAIDVNLVLDQNVVISTDRNSDYIEVEGGQLCWVEITTGAMSGAASTCDIRVMQSLDAGSNYYMAPGGKFQQLGPTNDNVFLRIPVFIGLAANPLNKTRVRLAYDVAGAAPSYAITFAALNPMTSLAPPAIDQPLAQGVYALVAAV